MRLLLIHGDMVAIYEKRERLAVFAGASQLDNSSAEQLRLASRKSIMETPIGENNGNQETPPSAA
jgi:hypothetical protein